MVLLVKMVFPDRKEKGDILGLEEFLEILRKEFLAFQGQSDPLENPAGMEHQANVASQVLRVFDDDDDDYDDDDDDILNCHWAVAQWQWLQCTYMNMSYIDWCLYYVAEVCG